MIHAFPVLGICPREMKYISYAQMCIEVFMTALFTIDKKISKNNSNPLAGGLINKMYISTNKSHLATKNNQVLIHATYG